MAGGYGGWPSAGNRRVSGRLLVRDGSRLYGFGRKGYAITGSHLGMQSEYHLFAADAKLIRMPKPQGKKPKRRAPPTKVNYHWSRTIPFLVRAMVLAGDTLFVAGPSDVGDLFTSEPKAAVSLWAVSPADGTTLAEYRLKAAPVHDSLAASGGRLFLTTVDGRVICYKAR
jgi:outer membrane protein assembly factor BamB